MKLKILFLAANPLDTDQLQLNEEARSIEEALRKAEYRDRFELETHWAVRVDDLQSLLLQHQPHIVHFSGHGSASHEIILQDHNGQSVAVPPMALGMLFQLLKDNIHCVVLNACYSIGQSQAIAQHIDCVVGMSDAATDTAAREYAASFYQGLAYGRTVQEAHSLGTVQIALHGLAEEHTPQLLGATDPAMVRLVDPAAAGSAATGNETKTSIHVDGGGLYSGGNVVVDSGGFIGRDKVVYGTEVHGDEGDTVNVEDVSGSSIAIGQGAKSIVNNAYSTINQLSSRALWGSVIGILLIAATLFWRSFGPQITPYLTPLRMDSTFNIAVVEFGEIQPQSSGEISVSAEGSDLSEWLYEGLMASYQQFSGEMTDAIHIIHKSSPEASGQGRKLAPLLFLEPAARCAAAEKLAGEINAQMLIYGTIDRRAEPAQFEISFYVSPDIQTWLELNNLQTGTSEDSTNCLPLGEALPVPLPFSNAVTRDRVSADVSGQGMFLFWLTLGLIQEQQGDWQKALEYFNRLETHFADISRHEARRYGTDLVNYLIGQLYIWQLADQIDSGDIDVTELDLSLLDKAAQNFQKAAALKGIHQHRAEKGLGDVWSYLASIAQKQFHQAGAVDDEVLIIPPSLTDATNTDATEMVTQLLKHTRNMAQALEHASGHYAKAAEFARQSKDPYVALLIEFSLADTTWAEGQLFYISREYDLAIGKMSVAVESFIGGNDSLLNRAKVRGDHRLVAKAYQTLGIAYFQLSQMLQSQNRHEERLSHLEDAEFFFHQCVSKKDDALLDKLISNEMVTDVCQPKLAAVQHELEEALAQPAHQ
ncbi:MAG: CHAT domain-containing protein [Chloroflexota bacterium]